MKIRHYGLLAPRCREQRLALCRRLLLPASVAVTLPDATTVTLTPARPTACPHCGSQRLVVRPLDAVAALPSTGWTNDTS